MTLNESIIRWLSKLIRTFKKKELKIKQTYFVTVDDKLESFENTSARIKEKNPVLIPFDIQSFTRTPRDFS
jgi:hypothetical protein